MVLRWQKGTIANNNRTDKLNLPIRTKASRSGSTAGEGRLWVYHSNCRYRSERKQPQQLSLSLSGWPSNVVIVAPFNFRKQIAAGQWLCRLPFDVTLFAQTSELSTRWPIKQKSSKLATGLNLRLRAAKTIFGQSGDKSVRHCRLLAVAGSAALHCNTILACRLKPVKPQAARQTKLGARKLKHEQE